MSAAVVSGRGPALIICLVAVCACSTQRTEESPLQSAREHFARAVSKVHGVWECRIHVSPTSDRVFHSGQAYNLRDLLALTATWDDEQVRGFASPDGVVFLLRQPDWSAVSRAAELLDESSALPAEQVASSILWVHGGGYDGYASLASLRPTNNGGVELRIMGQEYGDTGFTKQIVMVLTVSQGYRTTFRIDNLDRPMPPHEVIKEGTVGVLGDSRVGMNNMGSRTYVLPNGEERTGLSAGLFVQGGDMLIVGKGSVVQIAGTSWKVTAISQGALGSGTVTLTSTEKSEPSTHPGTVVFVHPDGREDHDPVGLVPDDIAWATLNGERVPVVKVVAHDSGGTLEIVRYGLDGQEIDRTIESPTNPKAVEIHGFAENAKLSAAVVTDNEVVYCLDRTEWPPDVVGKRVVVEGILEESDDFTSRRAPTGEVSAGTSGPVLVIRNSQYRVVELPGR